MQFRFSDCFRLGRLGVASRQSPLLVQEQVELHARLSLRLGDSLRMHALLSLQRQFLGQKHLSLLQHVQLVPHFRVLRAKAPRNAGCTVHNDTYTAYTQPITSPLVNSAYSGINCSM